jgi:hypothetical protein
MDNLEPHFDNAPSIEPENISTKPTPSTIREKVLRALNPEANHEEIIQMLEEYDLKRGYVSGENPRSV